MESTQSSTTKEKYPGLRDGSWLSQFRYGSNPWMARYVYGFIFLITNFLAWVIRDYGQDSMKHMGLGRFKECHGGSDCAGTEGVLRVSLGCFLFFLAMFISSVGTSKVHDRRDTWHSGWWAAKASMFGGFMVLPFLFPSSFVYIYGEIAHFGAGIFLLIQLVSVITFITWLNDCCQTEKYAVRCEPAGTSCNRKAEASSRTDWLTIISFIVALLTIVFATFSTGIDSQCFQFWKKETEADEDVPYGYGFFHFVFATGSMYFAMLLIGWNTHHSMKKWTIDVGWTSTWVRVVNGWLAACVYMWMLVAPVILKSRQTADIP
ncbi:hypothetical protein KSS87_000730 [Heliosperma pusillum]|nr:hypothetical protein KSS87_000730 [Heliosperma pusillum]